MRTLILGGYGNFGARIARALTGDATIALCVGGRDAARAAAFATALGGDARGVAIDVGAHDLASRLRELGADLVIHTAGPFQRQRPDVALACATAGAHYVDLADGRRFVCDFAVHADAAFRAAGRSAISGASTVPALSSAVVDHLTNGWRRIERIETCIAPAQTAPRGVATMAAVLSYCGEPIDVWRDGRWQRERGWAHPQRVHFARLAPRLGALCDIPDLELFPRRYAGVRDVMFRAALDVGASQRMLAWLAALRGAGLIPRPDRWARLLHACAPLFDRFGGALGGMVVRASGLDRHGCTLTRSWHIAADHDHGPEIPCMAAIVLARRLASGRPAPIGASACTGQLALSDFEPEFARWGMRTDIVEETTPPER
jgi:saccharopine dehydrogenase-like NADP-dependent oxidoreductase